MNLKLWAVSAFFLMGAVSNAAAAVVLDQFSVPETGRIASSCCAGGNVIDRYFNGQTVTAGASGKLARIDVGVFRHADADTGVTFLLLNSSASVVFNRHISLEEIPIFQFFSSTWDQILAVDVSSANLQLAPGDHFSFFLAPDPGAGLSAPYVLDWADGPISYGGGGIIFGPSLNNLVASAASVDEAFRAYVDTAAAIPEPSSWALLLAGAGVIGRAARRRRAAALRFASAA